VGTKPERLCRYRAPPGKLSHSDPLLFRFLREYRPVTLVKFMTLFLLPFFIRMNVLLQYMCKDLSNIVTEYLTDHLSKYRDEHKKKYSKVMYKINDAWKYSHRLNNNDHIIGPYQMYQAFYTLDPFDRFKLFIYWDRCTAFRHGLSDPPFFNFFITRRQIQ
jgi:hypothetical protein